MSGVGGRFVSRSELLEWINGLLDLHISSLGDLKTGAVHCLLLDAVHPDGGVVQLRKVDLQAKFDYDWKSNWRVVQDAFRKLKIAKEVPTKDLIRGIPSTLLEFTQFLYAHCQQHMPGEEAMKAYDPTERRKMCKGARQMAGTRFRGVTSSGYASPRASKAKENFAGTSNGLSPKPRAIALPCTSPYQPSRSGSVPTTPKLLAGGSSSTTSSLPRSRPLSTTTTPRGSVSSAKSKPAAATSVQTSRPMPGSLSSGVSSATAATKPLQKSKSAAGVAAARRKTVPSASRSAGTRPAEHEAAEDDAKPIEENSSALREEIDAVRAQVSAARTRNAECVTIVAAMRAEKDFYLRKAMSVAELVLGNKVLSPKFQESVLAVLADTYKKSS